MQNNTLYRLGIPQLSREQMVLEISERIRCARRWCQQHWQLLCGPEMNSRAKFQIYKFFVRPILTYGCELWSLQERDSKKLQRFECSILLEIYKSKYPHRHPNRLRPNIRAVYGRYRSTDVIEHVNSERLRWKELLKIEERALKRISKTIRPRVHWWDESPSKTNARQKQLATNQKRIVSLRISHQKLSCSRSTADNDGPG